MADETHIQSTGGNGERLELRLGTKAVGLQVKDLIPVLVLILATVGGYVAYSGMQERFRDLAQRQQRIAEEILHQRELSQGEVQLLQSRLQVQDDKLTQQTADLVEHIDTQMKTLQQMLLVHDVNRDKPPENRLPLELPPPPSGR